MSDELESIDEICGIFHGVLGIFFNLVLSILSVSWILFKMSSFNLIEIGTLIQLRTMVYLPSSFVQEFNYFFCSDRRVLPIQCIVLDILEFLLTNHFSRLIGKKYFTIKQNILRINKNKTMKKIEQFNYCEKTNAYRLH